MANKPFPWMCGECGRTEVRPKALGLTQKNLAAKIGVAVASLSRWENGSSIQARSTDKLLRMFFRHPNDPIWEGSDTAPENEATAGSLTDALSERLGSSDIKSRTL